MRSGSTTTSSRSSSVPAIRMRDIVATIQADQYGLIAREPEPPLVIQGGPGTKTAVGLHRASYLSVRNFNIR